jgi:hypothetical protein
VRCSASSSTWASPPSTTAADTSAPGGGAATDAFVADTGAADSAIVIGNGLTLSNATIPAISGTYDIQIARSDSASEPAFNGNLDGKIEVAVDVDKAGTVLTAHVWN